MELSDLAGMVKLCHRNVHKLQAKLLSYEHEVDAVSQALKEKWIEVDRVDGRLISVHDHLLSSLSDVNEHVIKLILHINLNRTGMLLPGVEGGNYVKHTNEDGIEVQLDMDYEKEKFPRRSSIKSSIEPMSEQMLVPMSVSCPPDVLAPQLKSLTPPPIPERKAPSTTNNAPMGQKKNPSNSTPPAFVEHKKKSSCSISPEPVKQQKNPSNSAPAPLRHEEKQPACTSYREPQKQQDNYPNSLSPPVKLQEPTFTRFPVPAGQQERKPTEPVGQQEKKLAETSTSLPVLQQEKPNDPTHAVSLGQQEEFALKYPTLVGQQKPKTTHKPPAPVEPQPNKPVLTPPVLVVQQEKGPAYRKLPSPVEQEQKKPIHAQKEKTIATSVVSSPTPTLTSLQAPNEGVIPASHPAPQVEKSSSDPSPPAVPEIIKLPIKPRQSYLLPPKGGTEISSNVVYNYVKKNIDAFPQGSICKATMMFLNIADNCFFVAKWGLSSKPLQKLLAAEIPLREVNQMPDFGEIFGIYDSQDNIIPRCVINAHAEGGGYEAYLIDYGEYLHLNGNETIFELPEEVKQLPAEAIKCYLMNGNVAKMTNYSYQNVILRITDNDGNDLQVELLEGDSIPEENMETLKESQPVGQLLNEEQKQILEDFEKGTSNAVKAVMGFKPTDDQRLCRYYDPKLNGCFKGNNCRLVHEPPAPFGATKDVELVDPLLDSVFAPSQTLNSLELGSVVIIEVTYICSPTHVYAQFVNDSPALIWTKKEINDSNRVFSKRPCLLDIVLAKYTDDCYYRAQIIDDCGGGEYRIFYVDYGNTGFVTLKSLAPCGPEDSLKPHRAICCHIEGVVRKPMASLSTTKEGTEYLKSRILNMQIEVKIIRQLPDAWGVHFQGSFMDVPNQLVKHGYALPNAGVTRDDTGQFEFNELADSISSEY
ncbi:uncharacterized protein LOC6638210 [Drosophila willistoni]|uniref:uncharacterized protein LOC6638210 n=1 Tax=Drosophila willistoni TaxID=7260 RepID=UPI001F073222|nr:uncharacterized protein LOC6638210 [Drosophila willistoni]